MKRAVGPVRMFAIAAGVAWAGGCSVLKPTPGPASTGVTSGGVTVAQPVTFYDGGFLIVKGTLHADAPMSSDMPGRVDIEFVGPGGAVMRMVPNGLDQRVVPADPSKSATYELRYDYHPDPSTTVRVRYVDKATAASEDAQQNISAEGPNGGQRMAGGDNSHPGGHAGQGGQAVGFGGSFGGHGRF
jgi:hypothetical protein